MNTETFFSFCQNFYIKCISQPQLKVSIAHWKPAGFGAIRISVVDDVGFKKKKYQNISTT